MPAVPAVPAAPIVQNGGKAPVQAADAGLLALAPAQSTVIAGLDLDAWRSHARSQWDAIVGALPPVPPDVRQLIDDVESVLVAAAPPQGVVLVRSRKPVNIERVAILLESGPAKNVAGRSWYPIEIPDLGSGFLAAADERTLMLGNLPENDFLGLLQNAGKPSRLSADTLAAVQKIQTHGAWVVVLNQGFVQQALQDVDPALAADIPGAGDLLPLVQKARGFTFCQEFKADKGQKWTLGVMCAGEADAGQIHAKLSDFWNQQGNLFAETGKGMAAELPNGKELATAIVELTESFKVEKAAAQVSISIHLTNPALQAVQTALLEQQKQLAAAGKEPPVPPDAPAPAGKKGVPNVSLPLTLQNGSADVVGALTNLDDLDHVRQGSRCKTYIVQLLAGKTYQFDMTSDQIDSYLRLEDSSAKELAHNDDGGGGLNSRIVFLCPRSNSYRVVATTFLGDVGPFRLRIQDLVKTEVVTEKKEDLLPAGDAVSPEQLRFQPRMLQTEQEEIALPGEVKNVAVGGGGRYLVMHIFDQEQLVVFDVASGKLMTPIPLTEDDLHFAAGAAKLAILYPAAKSLETWDLATMKKERSAPLPAGVALPIHEVCMGSASAGPLYLYSPSAKRTLAMSITSSQAGEVRWNKFGPFGAYGPTRLRVSPDGAMLLGYGGGWAGLEYATIKKGRQLDNFHDLPFSGGAFALPSADGKLIFAPESIFTRGGAVSKAPADIKNAYLIPAHEPGFFLALQSTRSLPLYDQKAPLPPVDLVAVYSDKREKVFAWTECEELKSPSRLPWELRLHYYPQARMLVTVADARLVLRRAP
jgi:hypothetical protein